MSTQNDCGNEESRCCIELVKSLYSSEKRSSCSCFSDAKPGENGPEASGKVVNALCLDRKRDKIHNIPLSFKRMDTILSHFASTNKLHPPRICTARSWDIAKRSFRCNFRRFLLISCAGSSVALAV